jgi:hypothetical protein
VVSRLPLPRQQLSNSISMGGSGNVAPRSQPDTGVAHEKARPHQPGSIDNASRFTKGAFAITKTREPLKIADARDTHAVLRPIGNTMLR